MKLAIIGSRGFPSTYGGFETFVRRLAPAWVIAGHEVTVYCRERAGHFTNHISTVDGVRCIYTPGIESKAASTLTFGLTAVADASFRRLDAVLVLNVANGFFLPALKARGTPTLLNTDGLEWKRGKWGPAAQRVFYAGARMSARYADLLISDSSVIADIWQAEFGVTSQFIPYGADILEDVGDNRVRNAGIEPGTYVLAVARLIPENNVDLLLDALALIPGTPAVVVGSANYDAPIERRLAELRDAGRIHWLGHVSDQDLLAELWANAGVYVHGHSVGGTNPALLQALGAGAATLALDTPFNREVLQSPSQLYALEPGALASHITAVLSDSALRSQWREHGRSRIAADYTWESVVDRYNIAIQHAIASAK